MINRRSIALAILAASALAPTWAAEATTAQPADDVVSQFRQDLQAVRADVTAKALTLTADQAAKFWPLFDQFQKEQNGIIDDQLKAAQKYVENYSKLTETDSLAYVNALLERDEKMHTLRAKWLAKFQTVLPVGAAARVIQIDRRLGLVGQIKLASEIPLVR